MNSKPSMSKISCLLVGMAVMSMWFLGPVTVKSQSTDQLNPTPVTGSQINGEIKARDLGDSRDTRYYYIFTGNRGDVFINVVTRNLNGSIDIFSLNGLSPRTKITLFADNPDGETGRIVYMRESEMLILRIQGRTPNDDPGTYQIKFAGSFAPATGIADLGDQPKVDGNDEGSVRVNSVGTIIEEATNPNVAAKVTSDADKKETGKTSDNAGAIESAVKDEAGAVPEIKTETAVKKAVIDESRSKPVVVVEDPIGDMMARESKSLDDESLITKDVTVAINRPKAKRSAVVTISRSDGDVDPTSPNKAEPTLEEQLSRVQLRVVLKNGESFSRAMNEVLSVNVIRGVLTIVTKDGAIQEFSILDVAKMSIE